MVAFARASNVLTGAYRVCGPMEISGDPECVGLQGTYGEIVLSETRKIFDQGGVLIGLTRVSQAISSQVLDLLRNSVLVIRPMREYEQLIFARGKHDF